MVTIVSATRQTARDFSETAPLGISLRRLACEGRIKAQISFENSAGLPVVYNRAIGMSEAGEVLVFIHDDVWIDDYFFVDRIESALRSCDVMGVAGNRRRVPLQPSWLFGLPGPGMTFKKDRENHHGAVAHGSGPFGDIHYFGPTPAECELLDGVLLAASGDVLRASGVAFDERFDFHFYDLDFCRSARAAGLTLGCHGIAITHGSVGTGLGKDVWRRNYGEYLRKWGD